MPLVGTKIETTSDNFAYLKRNGNLLVDKTLMIKEFWEGKQVSLITRPRRFGKTLNLSMLQHFFAADVNGEPTTGLFAQFAIAKIDDGEFLKKHQGQHPVIFISFKDIKETSFEAAIKQIRVLVQDLYSEHESLLNLGKISASDKVIFQKYVDGSVNNEELQNALKFLSKFLYKAYSNKKAIILIDEYDSPLTSAYEHKFLDDISNFLRNIFSTALKGNNYLEKGLMSGILRVSKSSMLSGLNNMKVYTLFDAEYSEYFGFTENEIQELIKNTGATETIDQIKDYYNGYNIGNGVIYNPWSAMQFFDTKKLAPHWVLTSNDKLLKDILINSSEGTKQQLGKLMQGETIQGEVDINLRYEDLVEKPYALWTLLLFCGYLTLESSELSAMGTTQVCQLRIPNQEVLRQYNQVFTEWLKEKIGDKYNSFLNSLVEGRVEEFTKSLTGYLFSCTSSHDFQCEADYHSFVLGLLASITQTHFLFSNKEYATGRPDSLLIPKDKNKTQGIILEFKYLHLDEEKRKDIDNLKFASHEIAKKALDQIDVRGYSYAFHEYIHLTSVLKVGIAFSNRIVSSAYVLNEIINGEVKALSSSQEVIIFDADETELPKTSLTEKMFKTPEKSAKNNKRSRPTIDDSLLNKVDEEQPLPKRLRIVGQNTTNAAHYALNYPGRATFFPSNISSSTSTHQATKPTVLTVQQGEEMLYFNRHEVSSDGDCGYTAFGITRENAYKLLADNLHQIRDLIKPAIQESLRTDAFIDYLHGRQVLTKGLEQAYDNYLSASIKGGEMPQGILDALDRAGQDLSIIQSYLNYDINDKRIDAGWSHPCILFALAKIQDIELQLWQLNDQEELQVHPHYPHYPQSQNKQRTDLLFVNKNHFELLEPREPKENREKPIFK